MRLPSLKNGAFLAGSLVALAVGASPLLVVGADHLDAPALGGLSQGGAFSPHSEHGDRDINDVYAFQGASDSRTVLAMTTNPATNFFGHLFGENVRYIINVDRTGDAVQDLAYVWRFSGNDEDNQAYTVTRYTGSNARTLAHGNVRATGTTAGGTANGKGTLKAFAGLRSDPFFFDLTGFVGTLFGLGPDNLGDDPQDFFAPLNTNALVVEVPDDAIGGTNIGVWGATQYWANGTWNAGDQMGRPAINTVFNTVLVDANANATTKNRFNTTPPSQQRTAYSGLFRNNIIATLTNINGAVLMDGCADWDATTAGVIADILLPDVLTYDTSTNAAGPLNGRALADDVIDAELALTTNFCPALSGLDGVDAHTDYLSVFPYLGEPHP